MTVLITKMSKEQWYDLSTQKNRYYFIHRTAFYGRYLILRMSQWIGNMWLIYMPMVLQAYASKGYQICAEVTPSKQTIVRGLCIASSFVAMQVVYNSWVVAILTGMRDV